MQLVIIGIVIFILVSVLVLVGYLCYDKENRIRKLTGAVKEAQDESQKFQKIVEDVMGTNQILTENKNYLTTENKILSLQCEKLVEENKNFRDKVLDNEGGTPAQFENRIQELKEQLDRVNKEIEDSWQKNEELKKNSAALETKNEELEANVKKLSGENEALETRNEKLKEWNRRAEGFVLGTGDGDNYRFYEFELTTKEEELVKLVREIEVMYPDLKRDLATIEWKKVWLPQVQSFTTELSGKTGIYRLVSKKDDTVSYVGQACDIKERWYQHIKKMVGVDVPGNEKLYKVGRPDELKWSVIELVGREDLNERERYWIEYFGCRERGLNR